MISAADRDLLQGYLDDTLPEPELAALENRLRVEPFLADALVLLAREEAVFKEWAASARIAETTRPDYAIQMKRWGVRLPSFHGVVQTVSGVAALVALAVLAWTMFAEREPGKTPALAVAHLEEVQGDVFVLPEFGDPIPAKSGQSLAYGQKLRTGGDGKSAVLTFADQSRVELAADTTIQLNASPTADPERPGPEVFVEQGQVAADAKSAAGEQPMIVQTPHAETRLSGTRSSVASMPNETRIEPERGQIRVRRKSDGRSIEVRPGEYAVAGPNRQFAARRSPLSIAETYAIQEGTGAVLSASFSADGSILAVGCWDGTIKLLDAATGLQRSIIRAHAKPVRAVAFSPVGLLLASGNDEKVLKFWDPLTGEELAAIRTANSVIDSLAFSPDGGLLVAAGASRKGGPDIQFWDVARRKEIGSLNGHKGGTGTAAFSPDGRTLATGGRDGTIKLWDPATRQLRQTLVGHAGRVNAVAFSPDGNILASGGADRMVRLWNPADGAEKAPLTGGHRGEIRALAFGPDGKTLASADNNVTFWDIPAGTERVTFRAHKRHIATMRFSPDGKLLATTGWDRMIRLWDPARAVP